tara:strand:- start:467 stop:610 length:144 start_codon:yes stop_codon:yes gene_type:complete
VFIGLVILLKIPVAVPELGLFGTYLLTLSNLGFLGLVDFMKFNLFDE